MNDLERRLHHAARELRSIDIEPPPLATISASRRPTGIAGRVPALVMPVLFVLGGLAVIAGGLGRTAESPDAGPAATVAAGPVADEGRQAEPDEIGRTLSVHDELALIAALVPPKSTTAVAPDLPEESVRTHSRSYR
jgi:hypothetical protein